MKARLGRPRIIIHNKNGPYKSRFGCGYSYRDIPGAALAGRNLSSLLHYWKKPVSMGSTTVGGSDNSFSENFDLRMLLHYSHFFQVTNPFIIYSSQNWFCLCIYMYRWVRRGVQIFTQSNGNHTLQFKSHLACLFLVIKIALYMCNAIFGECYIICIGRSCVLKK